MFPFNLINRFVKFAGEKLKPKTMLVSKEQLDKLLGVYDSRIVKYLNEALERYDIKTPLRISHFLSQTFHESNYYKTLVENLNYSKEGLLKTFPKYFNNTSAGTYSRKPAMIASRVYANRMGNGNEASQDGWTFRGRSILQNTGKDAYKNLSLELKVDLVKNPDLLAEYEYAFLAAGWYWQKNNLNKWADLDHLDHVSDIINLGRATPKVGDSNGWNHRKKALEDVKEVIL